MCIVKITGPDAQTHLWAELSSCALSFLLRRREDPGTQGKNSCGTISSKIKRADWSKNPTQACWARSSQSCTPHSRLSPQDPVLSGGLLYFTGLDHKLPISLKKHQARMHVTTRWGPPLTMASQPRFKQVPSWTTPGARADPWPLQFTRGWAWHQI